jgi:hypothetical protein
MARYLWRFSHDRLRIIPQLIIFASEINENEITNRSITTIAVCEGIQEGCFQA